LNIELILFLENGKNIEKDLLFSMKIVLWNYHWVFLQVKNQFC
jgi:hypothetical protein